MNEGQNKPKLGTEPYKGVRDFYPEDWAVQQYIFDTWKAVLGRFGYDEYNASILEPAELYEAKSGEEIVNEQTYTFTDRGDRKITLRPEMTPSVARMIAKKRKSLPFPQRLFSIPNLFRYERPQRGRLREHFQLNVDLFGVSGLEAEIELIQIAYELLKAFGLKENQFEIRVNDREYFNQMLQEMNLDAETQTRVYKLLDKKNKIDNFDAQIKELLGQELDLDNMESEKVQELIRTLNTLDIKNVVYDPSIVRGFDYYTGIVFEVFDTSSENNRSLFGGGRYDKLLDIFGVEPVPTIGFGMGDVTMKDVLETYNLLPTVTATADVYLCVLESIYMNEALKLAQELRTQGVSVIVDYSGKRVGDQIEQAVKRDIPYAICIGEDEIKTGQFSVKDLSNKEEKTVSRNDITACVK